MAKTKKRQLGSWPYVLTADRALPLDQQTRFILAPLIHTERAAFRDLCLRETRGADGTVTSQPTTYVSALEFCLEHIAAIENFPVGAPQAWPAERAQRLAYLEQLDDMDILEVGNEIWTRSDLGPAEAPTVKNSSTPELTSSSGAPSPAPATPTG